MGDAIEISPLREWRERRINPDNIPGLLKSLDNWVIWEGYDEQPDGKFKKRPVHPSGGYPINALDLINHLSFEEALKSHKNGVGDGLGIVLTGKPVETSDDGVPLFLVAVDLDSINERSEMARGVSTKLRTYREISPSGRGLRLMALSHDLVGKGNAGDGREMYCDKHFVTITGWGGKGEIRECTDELNMLSNEWWPKKQNAADIVSLHSQAGQRPNPLLAGQPLQENRSHIQRVESLLSRVPPDSPYDIWRDCIWSVASLGWDCGCQLAEDWSRKSAAHWPNEGEGCQAQVTLKGLFDSYDPGRGITLGTLYHHAEENDPSLRTEFGIENRAAGLIPDRLVEPSMPQKSPYPSVRLLTRRELNALPPQRWIVTGLLPETGLATIFGPPGSGKTFLALDLAASLATGKSKWFGRSLVKRPVVYAALEGGPGIKKRLDAWDIINNASADELLTILDPINLRDGEAVDDLISSIQEVHPVGPVVFIDTFAQATSGADENSSVDMGKAISATQKISSTLKGLVVLVHHSGKDRSKGLRGHSSMLAAVDTAIRVDEKNQHRQWKAMKVKDAESGSIEIFDLLGCGIGMDVEGQPETSCAVGRIDVELVPSSAEFLPTGKNQQLVYVALKNGLQGDKVINEGVGLKLAKDALPGTRSKHLANRAREALVGLVSGGYIIMSGGVYSLPTTPGLGPNPTP